MIDIKQRLQTIFNKQRLVFWYDDKGELQEQFTEIELDGIEKLVIDNNEFGLKRKILVTYPEQKFLIYSSSTAPKDEENWLLDLNLANYMFAADKISLILQNLELDVNFKSYISSFDKFFNANSRIQALKELLGSNESQSSLALKMMAVSISCDDNIESIMLRCFEAEKYFEILSKFNLETDFFKAVKHKFAYSGDSLKDLLYKLLQNHFYYFLDRSKCTLNSDARLFIKSWMDSNRYKESYKKASKSVSDELNIQSIITEIQASKVISCDTYEKCDQVVISYLLQELNSESISSVEMAKIIDTRDHTFWFDSYKNIYKALNSAALLSDFVKETKFKMDSFEGGIKLYSEYWYKADKYYRDYSLFSSKAEHLELLKPLNEKIENLYLNGYLRELNDSWQSYAQNYTTQTHIPHQQKFYTRFVQPLVDKKQKVYVIISDALRYECGVELSSTISSMDRYTSICESMVSSLPSYTQLGMASLLPHKNLSIGNSNDIVIVDGKSSSGISNRNKILKKTCETANAIGYEEFLKLNKSDGRELAKSSNVIYIYHDEIDKMGEKNEIKTFDAVLSTFESITKIVKQISNFNGSNIFITSDHGFLYTNIPTQESEFCKVDSSGSIKLNRRFIIGQNLKEDSCVHKFTAEALGIGGENEFLIPKSINKIRVQGGGNRFVHGGATLQELVIPLIQIKKKRSTDVRDVNVEIIPIRNITTNTINVALYQSEIVDEKTKPITLKIAFESNDGTILSDEFKHTFDSTQEYDTNRETRFKLTFKQDINEYNNQTIKLVTKKIIANSTETPLYKEYEVKLVLSFFNDFDDDF